MTLGLSDIRNGRENEAYFAVTIAVGLQEPDVAIVMIWGHCTDLNHQELPDLILGPGLRGNDLSID